MQAAETAAAPNSSRKTASEVQLSVDASGQVLTQWGAGGGTPVVLKPVAEPVSCAQPEDRGALCSFTITPFLSLGLAESCW